MAKVVVLYYGLSLDENDVINVPPPEKYPFCSSHCLEGYLHVSHEYRCIRGCQSSAHRTSLDLEVKVAFKLYDIIHEDNFYHLSYHCRWPGGWSGSRSYACCSAEMAQSIPSVCNIFVYSEVTSMDARRQSGGNVNPFQSVNKLCGVPNK